MNSKSRGLRTRAVHAGEPCPAVDGSVVLPIFQSSTFLFDGAAGTEEELRYVRYNNTPNHDAVGAKLAALEETERAIVTASGMNAISSALLSVVGEGDHILAQDCLYGGTLEFLRTLAPRLGIEVTFVPLDDPEAWPRALRPRTRAFYVETISNPRLEVGLLSEAAGFARERGLVSFIDNTFATPINFRPASVGFDVVLHSATKYLNGHNDLAAGVVAGSGQRMAEVERTLKVLGGTLDPHACFLLHRGVKTLPLRVRAQNDNALALAKALANEGRVEEVFYPGLESSPSHSRAKALFTNHAGGFGGMLSFVPRGGVAAARRLLERLQVATVAPSLGGVETLVSRPAVTSHAALPAEERARLGIAEGMVRVSVGIEDASDLVADFQQALQGTPAIA